MSSQQSVEARGDRRAALGIFLLARLALDELRRTLRVVSSARLRAWSSRRAAASGVSVSSAPGSMTSGRREASSAGTLARSFSSRASRSTTRSSCDVRACSSWSCLRFQNRSTALPNRSFASPSSSPSLAQASDAARIVVATRFEVEAVRDGLDLAHELSPLGAPALGFVGQTGLALGLGLLESPARSCGRAGVPPCSWPSGRRSRADRRRRACRRRRDRPPSESYRSRARAARRRRRSARPRRAADRAALRALRAPREPADRAALRMRACVARRGARAPRPRRARAGRRA